MTASSCSGSRWFKYYKQQIKEKRGITPAFLFELLLNKGRLCRKGEAMNVRKPVDYGTMYRELTAILAQNLPQMDEIYAIGKTISQRPEKGAAVAAAEFLQANFPDLSLIHI